MNFRACFRFARHVLQIRGCKSLIQLDGGEGLGVGKDLAAQTAGSRKGHWHNSRSPALSFALPGRVLADLGVPLLSEQPISKV